MDEIINIENEDITINDIEYEDDTSSEEDILLFKNISYKEQDEIIETIHELTEEFVKKDISQFSNPHILDIITNEIAAILMDTFINADICKGSDIDQIKLADFVESIIIEWFQQNEICYPLRQEEHMNYNIYTMVFGQEEEYIKPIIQKIISDLQEKNRKIPAQRTPEWYLSRHNMITASNLYQIFLKTNFWLAK
jgi:polyribonucleotide nucleotidyltransferase